MLRIEISGEYSGEGNYYPVNTLEFTKEDDKSIVLDRNVTEFTAENGKFEELWKGVYVWDGEEQNYNYDANLLDGASLSDVCVDEDCELEVVPEIVVTYSAEDAGSKRRYVRHGDEFILEEAA